uniref:hypothetical protein n=1 Tax=uncultured Halomonas sp. TaxID=173971 RepID=UPI0026174BB5
TPEFLNAEEEALFAEFMLGEEAIRFLNSDLGRVMRGFALMRREEAKEAILHADPDAEDGRQKIKAAQFQAAVADQFLTFVQDALSAGDMAEQNLKQMRDA